MRIDDKNMPGMEKTAQGLAGNSQVAGAGGVQDLERASGAVRSKSGPAVDDAVQLSGLASRVREADAASEAHERRLERLRELVAQGAYQPDLEKVSEALVDEALGATASGQQRAADAQGPRE